MMKRRTIKRFQRTFAVLGLLVVLSSFICAPVSAANFEGQIRFRNYAYGYNDGGVNKVNSRNITVPFVNQAITGETFLFDTNKHRVTPQVRTNSGQLFSSVTDIYFSFYPYITTDDVLYYSGNPYSSSYWHGNYVNSEDKWGHLNSVDVSSFVPSTSNNAKNGVSVVARYVGTEGQPISQLTLGCAELVGDTFQPVKVGWGVYPPSDPTEVYYYITSLRIITSDSTAESEAIAGVTAEIGAMSDDLQAMLGDIAEIVQAIYEQTGDINATLSTCKTYFEALLDSVDQIDGTVTNIYALLGTQFQNLLTAINTSTTTIKNTINTASTNIQNVIRQQTIDMQNYFDNVFGSAVNDTLTGETDDIQSGMDSVDNAEQGYISTATDRFDGIVGSFTGFNGSVASGVSLVSTLFERVWNSLGQYVIVYSFPLSLALVLLLIGRIGRASDRAARRADRSSSGKGKGG